MLKGPAELSQLGPIFRLGSPMQGAVRGGAGKGVAVPGELRVAQGGVWDASPWTANPSFGNSPFLGVPVARDRLPSPNSTCGWVSE